jgi:HNH endonuclease
VSERLIPNHFTCKGCGEEVRRNPPPQRDVRKLFCSKRCKVRAFFADTAKRREHHCAVCQSPFLGFYADRYCSDVCRGEAIRTRWASRRTPLQTRTCRHCGAEYQGTRVKTCSVACQRAWQGRLLRGRPKPQHATHRACQRCGRAFAAKQKQVATCQPCARVLAPRHDHGKPRKKSQRFGVAYVAGISPEAVFNRDDWRCQLCGRKTPKRLRGKNLPASPELDHIIPYAAGGGHTWDNVQCACRQCNGQKNARPLGQLRLAV